jgi:tetratricopeptide (TPR) repeat protein
MRTEPVADSILYATLDSFEGSLRRDQGRFEEARTMLARAILVYRVFGHETQAAKLLLTLSYVHYRLGRNAESLAAIHEALQLIDPATELRLACIARQNLASFLCDTGDAAGARRVLAESRRWFERFGAHGADTVFSLGVRWLEGRIAARLGETSQAEAALEAAAQGFAGLGIAYDTALVLLDLADTYLSAGRSEAVQELLPRIEPLLTSSDLHQESVAALLLLQNAIAQQLLSTSTVALVRAKIKKFERR